jgi:hypothetical protein
MDLGDGKEEGMGPVTGLHRRFWFCFWTLTARLAAGAGMQVIYQGLTRSRRRFIFDRSARIFSGDYWIYVHIIPIYFDKSSP